jgi:predicted GNAT superfamily acetyltransferase
MKNERANEFLIRNCVGFDELNACVDLQIETWGYDATDVIPLKAYVVEQRIGGQVMGAFDLTLPGALPEGGAESMVGFVSSWPGVKAPGALVGRELTSEPRAYLHSHMLAVRESYRNRGLGAQLKIAQRAEALTRGIRHMEWTFDPTEIKNAFLNLRKLGVRCRRYAVNFYGVITSKLQAGLPTDRLFAEWSLDAPEVRARLEAPEAGLVFNGIEIVERIEVEAEIYEWKKNNPDRALEVLLRNRMRFEEAFARGLTVVGFERDVKGNGIYQLGDEG